MSVANNDDGLKVRTVWESFHFLLVVIWGSCSKLRKFTAVMWKWFVIIVLNWQRLALLTAFNGMIEFEFSQYINKLEFLLMIQLIYSNFAMILFWKWHKPYAIQLHLSSMEIRSINTVSNCKKKIHKWNVWSVLFCCYLICFFFSIEYQTFSQCFKCFFTLNEMLFK